MSLSRRGFLAGAVCAALPGLPRPGRAGVPPVLLARPGSARLGPPDAPATPVWGYGGAVPGPTIRLRQGARIARLLRNDLPQPSSVHWHGVRIDNAMDGVPGLTQPPVPPGGSFLYDFAAPDAGTFWYHPHHRSWEQMARGLYGALIVEEEAPPAVDRDDMLLIDDWRLAADGHLREDFGALHDAAHAGRIGNWTTVNGESGWTRRVRRRERLRLRLANVANARIFALHLKGLVGWLVALDGQPLARPRKAGRLRLAPAQRADLILDVDAPDSGEAFLVSEERGRGYAIATFAVDGSMRAERLPPPGPLPANPLPALGPLADARSVRLAMEGGAMGALRRATLDGRALGIRDLAARGRVWALNGQADMPETPLLAAARGETVRIVMVNDTVWPHGMHLHGHHFRQVGPDGALGPFRDTLLVDPRETAEIALVADNPGDWLLHCHMLEHSDAGMKTWIRVG